MSATTVLFLGASHQQLAAIRYAVDAGYRVVTCDNRPDNPGHRLADRSHDVSTTDLEGVREVAEREEADGIVCYGSDIAARAAAYACEELGLPGNPTESVFILTDKSLFRRFQQDNGFFAPRAIAFEEGFDLGGIPFEPPFIVKPVDRSGSDGVSRVRDVALLPGAVAEALGRSLSRRCIVEELVSSVGYQVCGDGFIQDGRIVFHALGNEHFSPLTKVPVGESFPGSLDPDLEQSAISTLQSMFTALEMRGGAFNVDLFFTAAGEVFIIEIGPRNGGNRIPEAVRHVTGADMVAAIVEAALGRHTRFEKRPGRPHATYSIHALEHGTFEGIDYTPQVRSRIVDEQLFVIPGDAVAPFDRGSEMLGCLLLGFDSHSEMLEMLDSMDSHVHVKVKAPR